MTNLEHETLALLVSERAGTGREMTYVQLSHRAVDPETGYRPSANLLWKIGSGQDVKINPALVRAIAAGLSYPLERVQAAAAFQFTGYAVTKLGEGFVVHSPGAHPGDREREVLKRWETEEEGSTQGNHSD